MYYSVAQDTFQIGHVVVAEYFSDAARETESQDDRGVVLFVTDHLGGEKTVIKLMISEIV